MEFSLNRREFRESAKSPRNELGSIYRSCLLPFLGVAVMASRSLTQKIAGSNNLFKCNIFVAEFSEFGENI